ncbi:MAG: Formate dehydrogenase [Massilia sp.]|nr:Formate dehydrogenase [Massilia sp.]
MDKEKTRAVNPTRRSFLRAAGGAGALGALAAVAAEADAAPVAEASVAAEPAAQAGYHETEHIRQYYRTARYW